MTHASRTILREKVLAFAIAIVFAFFIGFGTSVFLEEPKYEDFCDQFRYQDVPQDEASCTDAGGKWSDSLARPIPKLENDTTEYLGYCDLDYFCRENYESTRSQINYITSVISIVAGLIAIYWGLHLAVESVSSGLVGGGTLTIIYGSFFRLFPELPDLGRFILLGVALAILIYLAYKKFGHKK